MSEFEAVAKIRMLNNLQIVDWRKYAIPEARFVLHTKDEDELLKKYCGYSWKGMNRLLRKCVGRLNP